MAERQKTFETIKTKTNIDLSFNVNKIENLKLLFDSDLLSKEHLLTTLSQKENFKCKVWIPLRLKFKLITICTSAVQNIKKLKKHVGETGSNALCFFKEAHLLLGIWFTRSADIGGDLYFSNSEKRSPFMDIFYVVAQKRL